ncbi:unnamed protein product [Effrenium voratum]|nr:unnamed protein product [Effrenium voratum]
MSRDCSIPLLPELGELALGLRDIDWPNARSLFCLEQKMLMGLDYHMEVCGELYASYYFALTEEAQRHSLLQSLHQESLMASSGLDVSSTMASERDVSLGGSPTPSSSPWPEKEGAVHVLPADLLDPWKPKGQKAEGRRFVDSRKKKPVVYYI